jgi:uncharacterized protein (DUF433 family)
MTIDRITMEPGKMNGQPCIRGMRMTVSRVLLELSTYGTTEDLIAAYPYLDAEDVRQALRFAAANLDCGAKDV